MGAFYINHDNPIITGHENLRTLQIDTNLRAENLAKKLGE
jgi:hypothetical protein